MSQKPSGGFGQGSLTSGYELMLCRVHSLFVCGWIEFKALVVSPVERTTTHHRHKANNSQVTVSCEQTSQVFGESMLGALCKPTCPGFEHTRRASQSLLEMRRRMLFW